MLTEQEEGKVKNIIDAFDNGKSVTELNAATSLGNNDVMEVLQGGENKKVPVSVVKESVNSDVLTDLNKRGVFNVTVSVPLTAGSYYTLSTAIAAVPTASKTLGLDLKFSTAANTWVVYRYKGSDLTGWATTTNWEQVPDAAKLSSLETDLKSKLGYIVCPTPEYTAGKVIVNAGFILTSGMRLLVKFTNANTVNTGVTLNINSTGAKPLIFRGKPVSYFNSWKAGEVVDVYYDGTNYMAEQLDSNNTELSELLKSVNADKSGIIGKNLINSNEYATGFLRSDNGNVTPNSTNFYTKSYIQISSSKRYIISGYTSTGNRVMVFYDKEGKKIDTGWDSVLRYSLTSVDGGTFPAGRNFYILEPNASIAPDWKTNGLATLPIPTEASYIRLNAGDTGNNNNDWRDTLMLEETTALIPSNYEKYGVLSSNINYTSFDKTLRESAIENLLVTNKFDVTKRKIKKYLSSIDATEKNQGDIGGKSFAISDYIPVIGGKTYYLSGRFVNAVETGDATALVFYDDLLNPIKPIDVNGNSYPSYRLPYLNGVVYAPINAVSVRFACMYYSTLEEISELQFINSSEPQEYIPFGSFIIPSISEKPVLINNTVLDGLIMIKSGNTYTGLRVEDIKILKSIVDEIYVLNDFTAGAKAKYQNYEIEYSHVLPLNGIAMTSDGVLVFMKNGVRYNINLTQA